MYHIMDGTENSSWCVLNKRFLCNIFSSFTGVHFIFTFIPIYLIDKVGRRRLLLFSVAGVCFSLILIAIGFLLINRDSAVIIPNNYSGIGIENRGDASLIGCLKYT